jgi:hypothetical protein
VTLRRKLAKHGVDLPAGWAEKPDTFLFLLMPLRAGIQMATCHLFAADNGNGNDEVAFRLKNCIIDLWERANVLVPFVTVDGDPFWDAWFREFLDIVFGIFGRGADVFGDALIGTIIRFVAEFVGVPITDFLHGLKNALAKLHFADHSRGLCWDPARPEIFNAWMIHEFVPIMEFERSGTTFAMWDAPPLNAFRLPVVWQLVERGAHMGIICYVLFFAAKSASYTDAKLPLQFRVWIDCYILNFCHLLLRHYELGGRPEGIGEKKGLNVGPFWR